MATTFTNTATLRYQGGTVESNVAVGAVEGVLSVSKTTAAQSYTTGDSITFVIGIVNNSAAAVTGVTVADTLGKVPFGETTVQPLRYVDQSVLVFSNGVLQPTPAVSTDDGLVLNDITVPANGSVIIIYETEVSEFASPEAGSVIENTVTVTATGVCEAEASRSVPAAEEASLALLKSVTPVPVAENGELTYTFTLQNTGNTPVTAEDDAVISDTFMPVLRNIRVTMNGTPLTEGEGYTYDEDTGVFSSADGMVTVPAAVYTQDPTTGAWSIEPGTTDVTVAGTLSAVCDTAP